MTTLEAVERSCIDLMHGIEVSDGLVETIQNIKRETKIYDPVMTKFKNTIMNDQQRMVAIGIITEDGMMSWGRVAVCIMIGTDHNELATEIARVISPWITENGGFDAMSRYFAAAAPKPKTTLCVLL